MADLLLAVEGPIGKDHSDGGVLSIAQQIPGEGVSETLDQGPQVHGYNHTASPLFFDIMAALGLLSGLFRGGQICTR